MDVFRLNADHRDPSRFADFRKGLLVYGASAGLVYLHPRGGKAARIVDLDLEPNPEILAPDFASYLNFLLQGHVELPNFQTIDTDRGLNTIAAGAGLEATGVVHVRLPGMTRTTWARAFLGKTQGQAYDGTGYVIIYKGIGIPADLMPIGRFEICQHSFVARRGGNPSRGWNPGYCAHCALDMTVDSSD